MQNNVLDEVLGDGATSAEWSPVRRGQEGSVKFNISVSVLTGTATLERLFVGSVWLAIKAYAAAAEEIGNDAEPGTRYRFTTSAGGSDAATVHLGN